MVYTISNLRKGAVMKTNLDNIKSELTYITPAMAKDMLKKNIINRDLSERLITDYATQMTENDWQITHQGVAFFEDGTFADGQNRLMAIVKANKTVPCFVTTGLPKSAAMAIDSGRKRSLIDGIKISGKAPWMQARHLQFVPTITYPKRLTDMQKIDFLENIRKHAVFAVQCFPTNRRHLTPSIIHAAIAMAHYHGVDEAKLIRFAEVFLDGAMAHPSERAIILVRDYFMNHTNSGAVDKNDKYLRVQRAIEAYSKDEIVRRLVQPQEVIYSAEGLF
jgi:hypothetical protein